MGFKFRQLMVALFAMLALGGNAFAAENEEICEPFKDGRVDESLLSGMLSAAEDGNLYRIQPGSSEVGFCVNSKLRRIEGNFSDFRGGMAMGAEQAKDGQTLVLIRTASLDTRGALVRSMIMGESFFDVERYPDALFVSKRFTWTDEDTARMEGDLTLRGITRPIHFDVSLTPAVDGLIKVKATATIDRADFGMDALNSMVDGDVQLCLTVTARKIETLSALPAQPSAALAEMVAPVPHRGNVLPG